MDQVLMLYEKIKDRERRDKLLNTTKKCLQKDMNLDILRLECRGLNGHVIAAVAHGSSVEDIAIKCVTNVNTSEGERVFWPRLKHKSILSMIQYDYLPDVDLNLFISPLHGCNLEQLVKEDVFLQSPNGLNLFKSWLKDILSAVNYLHSKEFCHLGITARSILISCEMKAILGDLYHLSKIDSPPERYDLLYKYKPPELCKSLTKYVVAEADGMAFDVWCIGIMVLKICTGDYIQTNIPHAFKNWFKEIYPCLFKILQKKHFAKLMKKAFPACQIDKETVMLVTNFITSCLQICPSARPPISVLMHHRLLDDAGLMHKTNDSWKKKGNQRDLLRKINEWKIQFSPPKAKYDSDEKTFLENLPFKIMAKSASTESIPTKYAGASRVNVEKMSSQSAEISGKLVVSPEAKAGPSDGTRDGSNDLFHGNEVKLHDSDNELSLEDCNTGQAVIPEDGTTDAIDVTKEPSRKLSLADVTQIKGIQDKRGIYTSSVKLEETLSDVILHNQNINSSNSVNSSRHGFETNIPEVIPPPDERILNTESNKDDCDIITESDVDQKISLSVENKSSQEGSEIPLRNVIGNYNTGATNIHITKSAALKKKSPHSRVRRWFREKTEVVRSFFAFGARKAED